MGPGEPATGDHGDIEPDGWAPAGTAEVTGPGPGAAGAACEPEGEGPDASETLLPYGAPGLIALSLMVLAAATVLLRGGDEPSDAPHANRPSLVAARAIPVGGAPDRLVALPVPPPETAPVLVALEESAVVPAGPAVEAERPNRTQASLAPATLAEPLPPDDAVPATTPPHEPGPAALPAAPRAVTAVRPVAPPPPTVRSPPTVALTLPRRPAHPRTAREASPAPAARAPKSRKPKPVPALASLTAMQAARTYAPPGRARSWAEPSQTSSTAPLPEPRRRLVAREQVPARRPTITLPKALRPVED